MVVLGAGMGCLMQTTSLIAQNSVTIRDLGAATGASTFVRNLGGSLGVAILGAIYASQVTSTLTEAGVSGASTESTGGLTPAVLQTLPPPVQEVVKQAIADGTHCHLPVRRGGDGGRLRGVVVHQAGAAARLRLGARTDRRAGRRAGRVPDHVSAAAAEFARPSAPSTQSVRG